MSNVVSKISALALLTATCLLTCCSSMPKVERILPN